ncbi:DBH-like monooxygenase protein 2 homolog [Thunnus albacares]|uniref:DBH-like monooxygenase protein 2 homolog n=1 Tax=Thunnus albacares TaxID=8236 RepID=UPI001CF6C01D|nr:DBH-like monooxygenase protein 2 homolog [Thunnus albacares]
MLSLLPFLYLSLVWTNEVGASDPGLPFMEYLDNDHLVCLKWGFDKLQGNITFKLVVNTTGWVGFGLSPNGGMKGSDIVMGGLGPSGPYFTDRYATGDSMPVVDKEQSYTLLSLTESDGQTIMTFWRSIQSCDDQDFHITAKPIKLIYAYGTTDEIAYHRARRGTKEVNLLNYKSKTTLPSLNYITATVENVTIPPFHTYYHCKVMKFPYLNKKHHIYQIEPVIDNPDIVHHMLLYSCPYYVTQPSDNPCFMGDLGDYCYGVVAAWGVGGGAFEFPEHAGIPTGGEGSDKFYRLEIHYNNPTEETGRTDSSGLRLHYTDQLRQHDVGILTTGLEPFGDIKYNIPPGATKFHSYGVCNTTLFSQLMNPVPDLQVFAVLLHTHLAGRKVRLGHFRNGKQIDFLALDENYNFEIQETISLGNIKTIKPGDDIVVECTYNTTGRAGYTKMGLATTDEMCLAFLLFYPAISVTGCASHPDVTNLSMDNSYQIAEYESLLKTLPQIQGVFDDNITFSSYPNGTVREMMKTPTVTCQNTNVSSGGTFWILNPAAGIIFLLVWIALM